MATAAQYLTLAYEQACQRLSELDTVAVSARAQMTYTDNHGQTVGWNEYRRALLEQIKELGGDGTNPGLIAAATGPYTVLG